MTAAAASFTGVATGAAVLAAHRSSLKYFLSGTFVATVLLERSVNGGLSYDQVASLTAPGSGAITVETRDGSPALYRWRCSAFTSGTAVTLVVEGLELLESRVMNVQAKIGGTAGWVLGGGAVNTGLMATLPASLTASKLVVPVPDLKVGDRIVGLHLAGQIESAGGAVTLDADLRKHVAAAADPSDASLAAIAQIGATADLKIDKSNSRVFLPGQGEVVAQDASYYVVLTGTTVGSTDIALMSVVLLVQKG